MNKTRRQQFARAYVKNGGDGAQAAIETGSPKSSAKVTGSRWLKQPDVQAEIEKQRKNSESKLEITIEKKMKRLWNIAISTEEKSRDCISAIAELNKMQGHYEKQKIDVTSNNETMSSVVLVLPEIGDIEKCTGR